MVIVVASIAPVSKLITPVPVSLLLAEVLLSSPTVSVPSFISTELPFKFNVPVVVPPLPPLKLRKPRVIVQRELPPVLPRNVKLLPLPDGN